MSSVGYATPPPPASSAAPLLGVYRRAGPLFVSGHGAWLAAQDGGEYLDFTSGIGVNALGHGSPLVARAVAEALQTGLIHTSNLLRTRPGEELAAELVGRSFADAVFFCNSGAEAVEACFKFARRHARETGGAGKHEIVALRGSFHGRLFGALAATDRASFREPFEPLVPGIRFVDPHDDAALGAAVSAEHTAAIIAEPVQGEGGIRPLGPDVLRRLRAAADAAGALLIFDEVQCGLGRTGRLFAYEETGIAPDLLALAKPLAGGLPMGAVLLSGSVAAAIRPGDHATTFGGGPLVCSVALAVLRHVSQPDFLEAVRRKGDVVVAALQPLVRSGGIRELRGRGLMWGIELERPSAPVVEAALDARLLLVPAGERVVRLLPPLAITEDELLEGLDILTRVLA